MYLNFHLHHMDCLNTYVTFVVLQLYTAPLPVNTTTATSK